jgi:hypothetical protein
MRDRLGCYRLKTVVVIAVVFDHIEDFWYWLIIRNKLGIIEVLSNSIIGIKVTKCC